MEAMEQGIIDDRRQRGRVISRCAFSREAVVSAAVGADATSSGTGPLPARPPRRRPQPTRLGGAVP